jgi:penicillin-binding protein 2
MIGAIANGGTIYKPRIVKYVESPDGEVLETTKPEILRQSKFKPETMEVVHKGLSGVFSHDQNGTARWAAIPGIDAAGKSGTVQLIRFSADKVYTKCQTLEKRFRHHGIFVAYAPIYDPKIAVAVVAEHACSGSGGAAPVAMEVIKTYLAKVQPDKYGEEALKLAKEKFWKSRSRTEIQQRQDEEAAEAEGAGRATESRGNQEGDDNAE